MKFLRPVAGGFRISGPYGEWGPLWAKHMDDSGAWVEGQVCARCNPEVLEEIQRQKERKNV